VNPLLSELEVFDRELERFERQYFMEVLKVEKPEALELAPFRPGWVLVFYPAYIWVAPAALCEYVKVMLRARYPAENSPVEQDMLRTYYKIRDLFFDIYCSLKIHDVESAVRKIDDVNLVMTDLATKLDMVTDILEWNGTKQLHEYVAARLQRIVDWVNRGKERMQQEINRPRVFDIASYERFMKYIADYYRRKIEYWKRLAEMLMRRWVRLWRLKIIPMFRLVSIFYDCTQTPPKATSKELTWYPNPWTPPGKCSGPFALIEEVVHKGGITWRIGWCDNYPSICMKERLCPDGYNDLIIEITMIEPRVIKVTIEGGKSTNYNELRFSDQILWTKEPCVTWDKYKGEFIELTIGPGVMG